MQLPSVAPQQVGGPRRLRIGRTPIRSSNGSLKGLLLTAAIVAVLAALLAIAPGRAAAGNGPWGTDKVVNRDAWYYSWGAGDIGHKNFTETETLAPHESTTARVAAEFVRVSDLVALYRTFGTGYVSTGFHPSSCRYVGEANAGTYASVTLEGYAYWDSNC
jgi:hypothetical protein